MIYNYINCQSVVYCSQLMQEHLKDAVGEQTLCVLHKLP